jgi:hypothetical protein
MFGIEGTVGSQLRKTLSDALRDQLLQQQMQQRIAEFDAEQKANHERLELTTQDMMARREAEGRQQRSLDNRVALEEMQLTRAAMDQDEQKAEWEAIARDPATPATVRSLIPLLQSGAINQIPADVLTPPTPPTPKKYPVTVPGPDGRPMERLASEEEMAQGVPVYREPKAPTSPSTYNTLVNPEGKQRQAAPGAETNALLDQGWRLYEKGQIGSPADETKGHKSREYAVNAATRIVAKVDALTPRLGPTTTGVLGKVLSVVPWQTQARDVAADIESLAADIAYKELVEMRRASPTGGAVGNVSDYETRLLSGVIASVRQDQSESNLRKNLAEVRASAERIKAAAEKDAAIVNAVGDMRPVTSRSSTPQTSTPPDLIWDGKAWRKPGA